MTHHMQLRVYYEDTDLAGIVYYANYLKFIERGRSEWLRELGLDQAKLKAKTGQVFAVRRVVADYLQPAKFDDLLEITTALAQIKPARLVLDQTVLREGQPLFAAQVTIVCLAPSARPTRLPGEFLQLLSSGPDD